MPLINRGVKAAWWARPWRWLDKAQEQVAVGVDLLDHYEVARFSGRSVRFRSTRADDDEVAVAADVVVLATGYRQTFPFLRRASDGFDDALPAEHFICDVEEPDLAFFGFARPNVGAIPPMSELQAMWWVAVHQSWPPRHRRDPTHWLICAQVGGEAPGPGVGAKRTGGAV